MQNPSGGFASYELVRGSNKLEWLNNSEVFGRSIVQLPRNAATDQTSGPTFTGDTMVEHCYPESVFCLVA